MQELEESLSVPRHHELHQTRGRRRFLRQLCGGAAAAIASRETMTTLSMPGRAATSAGVLPLVQIGPHRVTRLIAGGNPIGGWSHATLNLTRHMLEHFTLGRTIEFLEKCEGEGINTWQYDHESKAVAALRSIREKGSKLQFICLHATKRGPLKKAVEETNPIALVHHGGVTDSLFRAGKAQEVHDFVKQAHDLGVLAGVSSHNPDNIRRIFEEGWENDLFMTCLYYLTRPREEQQQNLGKVAVGEPFFESDPVDMTRVIRQVAKPCLAFKILAAGRLCWEQKTVDEAFQFAFQNIKPSDAVIVGMFPRYEDEVRLNIAYVRKYGQIA
jgi:hypothetical protein